MCFLIPRESNTELLGQGQNGNCTHCAERSLGSDRNDCLGLT